jgi:hypothetical protein
LQEYADYLPLTVRQIFYRLVGAYDYPKSEQAYERLAEKLVRARRARMVDFEDIRDDGVSVMAETWFRDQQHFIESYAERARRFRRDLQQGQDVRIELWSEAAGMMPQLARVASRYSVPVYSAGGFVSLSAVRSIVDRACDADHPLVVLHVGDYDPSGESIFDSMMADAGAFIAEDKVIARQDVIPVRVALTADQVGSYGLPTAPPKKTDSRSARWEGETCQLEALPPDAIAAEVENALLQWFDEDTLDEQREKQDADRVALVNALPRGDG